VDQPDGGKVGRSKVFASAYIGVAMSPDIPAGELFVNPNQDTEFDSEFAVWKKLGGVVTM